MARAGARSGEAAKIIADAKAVDRGRRLLHRRRRRAGGNRRPTSHGSVAAPVIGIGASAECDGQVLVTDDMLGMFERTPRFVKRYDDLAARIGEAARNLCRGSARAQLPDRRPDLPAESR